MWVRQAFYRWLIPAAFVLPLWLFVGWIVFGANPWALLWVLLSAPLVLIGQLILTLLIRARGTVRSERAVSWTDAAAVGAWHVLVIGLGVFDSRWWWIVLLGAVAVGVVALWTSLTQLWREARGIPDVLRSATGQRYVRPGADPSATTEARRPQPHEVIVITESTQPDGR